MKQDLCVGLCDDEKLICEMLRDMITDISSQLGISCRFFIYTDASLLLKNISDLSIVFLDIDMPQLDGIAAGHQILVKNPSCQIIMATGMVDRMKEAFAIRALRFVTKPFQEEEIREAFSAAIKECVGLTALSLFRDRIPHSVPQKDIQYIRAYNGYVEAFTSVGVFRKDTTLDEMALLLDERMFYRIHRSYIVNFSCISSFSPSHVIAGGQKLPVARRKAADFQKKFAAYELG